MATPEKVVVDTGVFIRGMLGEHATDPRAADCKEAIRRLRESGVSLVIPAVVLLEAAVGSPVPIAAGFSVREHGRDHVKFRELFPQSVTKAWPADATKKQMRPGVMGDCLVVATAVVVNAAYVLTLDVRVDGTMRLATMQAKVQQLTPSEVLQRMSRPTALALR